MPSSGVRRAIMNGTREMAGKGAMAKAKNLKQSVLKGDAPFLGVLSSANTQTTREMVKERAIKKAKSMRGTYGPRKSFGM